MKTGQKLKICVVRNAHLGARVATGVFAWRGPSWIRAELVALVKELPSNISDADLGREYRAACQVHRAAMQVLA